MDQRLKLHELLVETLGTRQVYFQPPPSVKMQYPCIVYKRNRIDTRFADNLPYSRKKSYTVTVIDRDPDSDIPDKVGELPLSSFERHYTAADLNHDVYNLYF